MIPEQRGAKIVIGDLLERDAISLIESDLLYKLLDQAEALSKENAWIPCGEELPEKGKEVLLYILPNDGTAAEMHVGLLCEEDSAGFWELSFCFAPFEHVTHWRHLPKHPKEE